jgi:hypothetical protein
MNPPSTATKHLLAALRASRGWQHRAIAEAVEVPVDRVPQWGHDDLDRLDPAQRRNVEEVLSTSSTRPWWSREHHD